MNKIRMLLRGWELVFTILLTILLIHTTVFAQSQWTPGPEPRHGPGNMNQTHPQQQRVHGFCYSGRTQKCSSIFTRGSSPEIAQECTAQGWYRYYAFPTGHEARISHQNMCVNP